MISRFWPKNPIKIWRRPFFLEGGSTVFGPKKRLKFRFRPKFMGRNNQKCGSRSLAVVALFRNSPPLFQILATRLAQLKALYYRYSVRCAVVFSSTAYTSGLLPALLQAISRAQCKCFACQCCVVMFVVYFQHPLSFIFTLRCLVTS